MSYEEFPFALDGSAFNAAVVVTSLMRFKSGVTAKSKTLA
jgi:hypothetical protein